MKTVMSESSLYLYKVSFGRDAYGGPEKLGYYWCVDAVQARQKFIADFGVVPELCTKEGM